MPLKSFKPTTSSRRGMTTILYKNALTKKEPEKFLTFGKNRKAGRAKGTVSIRHKGGGAKKLYRIIDFKQGKFNISGVVKSIEYDPNRGAFISLVIYKDGEKRYILTPSGLKINDEILSSEKKIEEKIGNRMKLRYINVGTPLHNLELFPKRGGQITKGAGTAAFILAKEGDYAKVKLPSGEIRKIHLDCFASIGQVSNPEYERIKIGKAGRTRWLGIRPTVRGKAMHPAAHPHGGGEGRSPIGLKTPKTPWGKPTKGYKTRRRKYSERFIIKHRK